MKKIIPVVILSVVLWWLLGTGSGSQFVLYAKGVISEFMRNVYAIF